MPQPMMPSGHDRSDMAEAGTSSAPVMPGASTEGAVVSRPRGSRRAETRAGRGWQAAGSILPLLIVLAVQAALSVRLVWADTAFQDEATYLWAGHLEWAHWLHGAPIPPFPTYFSGAPVIYPPLGALADSVGGLAGARFLSLVFMLGATALLWSAAGRLYGRRAALFAAALFAVSGPVLHLGAFATYDALSVLLVALAAWCVIRAGDRGEGTGWMAAAGVALAVGNAAAYASALFVVVVLLVTAGLLAGGKDYLTGIGQTTLARVGAGDAASAVLADAWSWTGLIVLLAVAGVIISWAG